MLPSSIGIDERPVASFDERRVSECAAGIAGESCADLVRRLESCVFEVAAFLVWQELAPEKACGGSKVTLADTGATATVVRLEFTWRCSVDAEVLDVEMHVGTVQGSGTFTPPPSVEKEHDRLHSILYICPITHVGPSGD